MKILLVYPEYPDTFWSFKHSLKLIAKKAAFPPLGLLTVAAMLPGEWEKKLVDMNVSKLTDDAIIWADYVFISAMIVQKDSAKEVIRRAKGLGVKTVAGGPLFTTEQENFPEVDHLVLNEAEATLPLFLADFQRGISQKVYTASGHPEITNTPLPIWPLIDMSKYSSMSLQYSRGCPFNCEFCDIMFLDGRIPRTKSKEQVLAELDAIYNAGWRGPLFIVDDNFIGNKEKLKAQILPEIIDWLAKHKYPFTFFTEASINLADDKDLINLMVKAGFTRVFIGIETPNAASLVECEKKQNSDRDLIASVRMIQSYGIEVMGGFIVGFDNDPETIFEILINFIQKSGIVVAMVGILNAPRGTRLYERLQREGRLTRESLGNNVAESSLNFIPKMNREVLLDGYRKVLRTIYSHKYYNARVKTLLESYRPKATKSQRKWWSSVLIFFRGLWFLVIRDKKNGRYNFWLFFSTLFTKPRSISIVVSLLGGVYHFRKVTEKECR